MATLEYHSPKRIQTRWWLVAVMFLIFVGCLVLILGVTDVAPNPPIPSKPLTGK